MDSRIKPQALGAILAALLLTAAACSAAADIAGNSPAKPPTAAGGGAPAVGAESKGGAPAQANGGADARGNQQSPLTSAAPRPAGAPGDLAPLPASQPGNDRMIVYTTEIALNVESVPDTVASVSALAEGLGGYVASSSSRVQGDKDFATVAIKVPASAYNQAMTQLRKMGVKVASENGTSRDVTEEFTDLAAQAKNLEATELQLQALMVQAKTIDDIIKVQTQLTQVRTQIERLKGRLNLLQRTSDFATITVSISPVVPGTGGNPQQGWDPGKTFAEAWEASMQGLVRFLDAGIRVTVMSWWLIALGVGGWAVVAGRRRGRAKPPAAVPGPVS